MLYVKLWYPLAFFWPSPLGNFPKARSVFNPVGRLLELLLLLSICGGVSFLLHSYRTRPTIISGTVVDWTTGKPVAGVTIGSREPNSSTILGSTDAQGRFTIQVTSSGRQYLPYAEDRRFGPLLRATFGRSVSVYTNGQQDQNVIVPAIPATELSGHVYDEFGKPISGCEISVLPENPEEPTQLDRFYPRETDQRGAFIFAELGSGRFFVVARCPHYLPGDRKGGEGVVKGPWRVRNSWPATLFPNAPSLAQAKAIVLLPGDQRSNIDFHLWSVPQYSFRGKLLPSKEWTPIG